ncbi:porin, partial [Siphonobacter sp.]|uniref:porin n=1 Tax=Siphonobacter sp. TaxID=1869184 RepID=UPI003B3BD7E0
MKKAVISVFSLFCLNPVFAEVYPDYTDKPKAKTQSNSTPPTDEKKPTEEQEKKEKKEEGKITFSGYLDTYYMFNFNNPASRSNLGTSGPSSDVPSVMTPGNARAFDQKSGQFSLGLIQTKVAYTNDKIDAVADLTFGPNADLGNYGNYVGPLGAGSTSLAIKQAYLTYKFSSKFSVTAGQFGTHIGYEVIDAPVNYNYSLSNLFNNGPFYHIGAKAQYSFSDRAYLMAGVVNNIDNLNDNNKAKAIISQFFFSPATNWNVYVNWIGSNEAMPDSLGKTPSGNFYSLL